MKKLRLLIDMLMMSLLVCAAIAWGSPYTPAAQICLDIEEIWNIEDTLEESEVPLIARLENHGVPLAYSAEENRFYCPLDLSEVENGWPDIHLTAPESKGMHLLFADDYTYDWCTDAVRDGYAYQMMAYNDEQYAYFEIVFTGMMQMHLYAEEEFGEMDIPIEATMSYGLQSMSSHARAHYRGGITLHGPKKAYRVEFTRNSNGKGKIVQEVPVLGQVKDLLLIPMMLDSTMMHDRISWDMYAHSRPESESYGARKTTYVELFVNDSYEGIYLLLEPFDHVEELNKAGGAQNCAVYRTGSVEADKDRPNIQGAYVEGRGYELHYEPTGAKEFAALRDFIDLCSMEDDQEFAARSLEIVDLDSMLHYVAHLQMYSMIDNVFNNFFVIASSDSGKTRYSFAPWDMDMTWGMPGNPYDMWVYFPPADRMINLDAGGIVRDRLYEIWTELRAQALTYENIEKYIEQYVHELNDSGAWMRNAERWELEEYFADGNGMLNYAADRLALLDRTFEAIRDAEGPLEMFVYDDYENKYTQISGLGVE